MRLIHVYCIALLTSVPLETPAADSRPPLASPKEHFGFQMGEDYCLANYQQLRTYWSKLEQQSDRVRVMRIGTTEEGREQLMAIVTSPANHRRLAHYQDISRRLARADGVNEAEARKLAAEGKAVVWIDGGLHASEVLCAQALIETAYQLAQHDDPETRRFLDDVIILLVHANPDGMDLCADWYMREADPKKRTLAGLPRLYQKYIGHDNNRDFYANTQAETRNMNRVMYIDWLPQIVYNHHQSGPPGSVLFCPPFRDPFNYHVDPLVINGIDAVGAAMMQRFLAEGKPGATCRSGARYSTWWNGGLRTTCYFHNMIGLLTETIGNPTPMQIPFNPSLQLPRADYLAPVAPQTWHFRQSVDYSVTANKAVIDYASRYREQLLYNIWLMGKNAIERGNRDSWTITPKVVDLARAGRGANAPRGRGGAEEFARLFRDPVRRDPRGYIVPANQPDFLTATKFINALLETGIRVHRARSEFTIAGKKYPSGSYVVKSAQAFRAHLLDLFEPQDHPNDFPYPGAPPTPPYDSAGWTLAFQMGVRFDRILDGFEGPFEEITGPVPPPRAQVYDVDGAVGFFLHMRTNDAFRALNRLLKAGQEVRRLQEPFTVLGATHPSGMFFITRKANTLPILQQIASDLGTRFIGSPLAPGKVAVALRAVRVGLWDRYGGSMPSGWTRWLLERFEFPFQVVFAPELDRGGLREKFDVLLFVDGAIPNRGGPAAERPAGGDQPPPERDTGSAREESLPAEYRGRRGSITPEKTIPQLRRFLDDGGTILTIGSSTSLAYHLGLPLTNHLATTDKDGRQRPLPREKYYVPGSVLRVRVDSRHPLAWGMPEDVDVMFAASPTFQLGGDAEKSGLRRVAWFDGKTPLRSGWAWGQEYLEGGVAVAEAHVGKGKLVLFGPQILFRGQPHGTFKFLFNGIVQAGIVDASNPEVGAAQFEPSHRAGEPHSVNSSSPPSGNEVRQSPHFRMQEIETGLSVGYAVLLVDLNGDGKKDIVVVDTNRVVWYENPTWKRRIIIQGQTKPDNVCIAAHDIDGDGQLDLALGSDWKGINTKVEGTIQWLRRGKSLDDPWTIHPIGAEPTVHRMRFADLYGEGKPRLIVAPLLGRNGTAKNNWMDSPVRVLSYKIPSDPVHDRWVPEVVDESMHVVHNFFPIQRNESRALDLLCASFEGVNLLSQDVSGKWTRRVIGSGNQDNPKSNRGASEIKQGQLKNGRPFVATIEPWHGNQVVVYTPPTGASGTWNRHVLDEQLKWGHAVWCADLDGDGSDELIIGVRDNLSNQPDARCGVRVYKALDGTGTRWQRQIVEAGGVAVEDLAAADLNGDGRIDLVAVGRQTHNVRIYWNERN